jgi:hypothetical protein
VECPAAPSNGRVRLAVDVGRGPVERGGRDVTTVVGKYFDTTGRTPRRSTIKVRAAAGAARDAVAWLYPISCDALSGPSAHGQFGRCRRGPPAGWAAGMRSSTAADVRIGLAAVVLGDDLLRRMHSTCRTRACPCRSPAAEVALQPHGVGDVGSGHRGSSRKTPPTVQFCPATTASWCFAVYDRVVVATQGLPDVPCHDLPEFA